MLVLRDIRNVPDATIRCRRACNYTAAIDRFYDRPGARSRRRFSTPVRTDLT
jgi:hypothetical protein